MKETLVCDHSNDTIEQLFYMKLFYTVQGGSKIFTDFFTDHSNERYWTVLSWGTVYYAVQGGSNVDQTLACDHSTESYWAVLSCGTVYYAVQGGSNVNSEDEILACGHSHKSYRDCFYVTLFFHWQGCSNFWWNFGTLILNVINVKFNSKGRIVGILYIFIN